MGNRLDDVIARCEAAAVLLREIGESDVEIGIMEEGVEIGWSDEDDDIKLADLHDAQAERLVVARRLPEADLPDLAVAFRTVGEALRELRNAFGIAFVDKQHIDTALALVDAWLGDSDV